ncbi:MAG TPA: acylphosphatase [Actinomycetaceae bacterium]|nr:acylphosphatase [Actinomycetaceae bacterium]
MIRRRAILYGEVQGVGMRMSCAREARARGVNGWIRNAPDGTVEAELEGDRSAVDGLLTWLYAGPPAARVLSVDVTELATQGEVGFDVR